MLLNATPSVGLKSVELVTDRVLLYKATQPDWRLDSLQGLN